MIMTGNISPKYFSSQKDSRKKCIHLVSYVVCTGINKIFNLKRFSCISFKGNSFTIFCDPDKQSLHQTQAYTPPLVQ